MNKSELVDSVASDSGVSKSEAEGVLNAFFDTVRSEAKGGNVVGWPGFGKFLTSTRAARPGRNPRTGETVKVKASTGMKFRSSSVLKQFLNAKGSGRKSSAKAGAPSTRSTANAKKAPATTAAAKKAPTSRAASSGAPAKRSAASKGPAAKTTAKKAPANKATANKATANKATANKATASKAPASKASASKASAGRSSAPASKAAARKAPAKRGAAR